MDQCSQGTIDDIIDRLRKIADHIPVVKTVHKPVCLETQQGFEVGRSWSGGQKSFCVLRYRQSVSFRKSIENLGAEVLGFHVFPDHHAYTRNDLKKIG